MEICQNFHQTTINTPQLLSSGGFAPIKEVFWGRVVLYRTFTLRLWDSAVGVDGNGSELR